MGSKRPYFRSYPYRRYNQLILVSFDLSECLFSENGWCGGVTGVHHVELTPYLQQQAKKRAFRIWEYFMK